MARLPFTVLRHHVTSQLSQDFLVSICSPAGRHCWRGRALPGTRHTPWHPASKHGSLWIEVAARVRTPGGNSDTLLRPGLGAYALLPAPGPA